MTREGRLIVIRLDLDFGVLLFSCSSSIFKYDYGGVLHGLYTGQGVLLTGMCGVICLLSPSLFSNIRIQPPRLSLSNT